MDHAAATRGIAIFCADVLRQLKAQMFRRHLRRASSQVWLLLLCACAPPTAEELLSQAEEAIAAGETRTAEIHLRNLLDREPNHVLALVSIGEVFLAVGKAPAAEQSLRRALELGGDASVIHLPLLQALLMQQKFAGVLALIEKPPHLQVSDQLNWLMIQAAAHRGLDAPQLAEEAYRKALAVDPRSALVRGELAAFLLDYGRLTDASALIAGVLIDEPNFVPALILHGNLERMDGRYGQAEAAFQRAVEIEGMGSGRSGARYVTALSQLIETQLAQGKLAHAAANADSLLALNVRNPVGGYLMAQVEAGQGKLEFAKSRLLGVIAAFPEYWRAHALLGAIYARQNQPNQATMYLRAAVNNDSTDLASRLLLAQLYIRFEDLEAARRLLDDSAALAASGPELLALSARASLQAGRPELASAYFDRSEEQKTNDPWRLATLTSVYLDAGEFDRATRVLASASLEGTESKELKNYLLALVQLRQGDLEAAAKTASYLVERYPDHAWPLNMQGSIALRARNLTDAKSLFSKALELEASNVPALLNLARVAIALNDKAAAAARLQAVLEIDPIEVTALLGLTQLAVERGDFAEAQRWLNRTPESAARLAMHGSFALAQKDFRAAATSFSQAFAREPSAALAMYSYAAAQSAGLEEPEADLIAWNAANPQDAKVNFQLGSIALANGNAKDAIARYEAVLIANPRHVATLNNLAWLYGEQGDDRALDLAETAHALEPDNPAISDTLGWLHVRRGDASRGLALLEHAVARLPQDSDVRYHWAVVLTETGNPQRALEILQDLLATGGDFSKRGEAEERVAELQNRRTP